MSPAANSGAASTTAARVVVPTTGVVELTAVAAPDALGAGDVLEDEELCRKKIYSELNLTVRWKKAEYKKIRQTEVSKRSCRVVWLAEWSCLASLPS
jgi:hypothetical protein